MADEDLKSAALELAREGTRVFPVGRDKKPRNSNGFHGATTDPEQIDAWNWNGGGAIGAAIDEGCFVVDCDPRHGSDKTVQALLQAGLRLPATRVVETQSGGTHRYYRLPPDLHGRKLKGSLGPGIDVKVGGKGYVLVPPSPGYSIKFDRDIAEAPQWMIDELLVPEQSADSEPVDGTPRFFEFETGTPYGVAAMERELGRLTTALEGDRNNALNRAAFALSQLAGGGELNGDHARELLALAGERMGLSERECSATIESGWTSGLAKPRQAPELETGPDIFVPTVALPSDKESDQYYWLDWEVEEPPPPFYLYPLVPKNAYVLVYGATESSKSMVMLALAAQGSHLGVKSSIYSLENPSHIDRDRVRRLGPDKSNFRITNQPIDLNDTRQIHKMIERNSAGHELSWEDGKSTDWIILDTYSHSFNSRSEDGNAKAIEFARRIRYIMAALGCTVIVVDHTGYSDHGEPRDASAKRQQVDVAIYMEKIGEWQPKMPSRFSAVNKKSARFGNPFRFSGEISDEPDRRLKLSWLANNGKLPEWQV